MIYGIGVDIVRVERLEFFYEGRDKAGRFFSPEELDYIREKPKHSAMESLAAAFAAKEAFGKALGTGLRGLVLSHISVTHEESGKPVLVLREECQRELEARGITRVHVSLSHERDSAIAVVLLEKD